AEEFARESRIHEIVKKHSDYVRYPIFVGDDEEQANRQVAIWRQSPREVKDEDYQEFYQHLTLDFEPPLEHIHTVVDAPLRLYALLYIPTNPEKNVFSLRKEDGLKLYARKILIQEYTTELLPKYFRFIQGVVDAEDLPLNVSRETIQSNPLIIRIRKILTSQVINKLEQIAKKDDELYEKFWNVYSNFLKEGIATAEDGREELYPLLRFKTTKVVDRLSSLNDYIGRMKAGQKKIYYILGDDETSVLQSPHLDYFNKHEYEVITFTNAMDSFMLINLREYEGFEFT
ncbi:MAG: molecular chaperone HtpG, partial [candidate division Zixibacteria bacterium]|nr:molecular chaperone HtpG [candidate division Zixibacteria bacterium]NIR62970.1 molecular chaperone HtpG [candidate division Zixibacteria bacterium]NIS44991.1 molecular chaperone HtpG [candidate division Zixibacteria bacterium]NIT52551.1 molecular chaperone HtpG [candidate division Zixibacteria bacterium]NIU13091.1 molecular chaperone HtpG [candidate division Zixibacteria bacterium]